MPLKLTRSPIGQNFLSVIVSGPMRLVHSSLNFFFFFFYRCLKGRSECKGTRTPDIIFNGYDTLGFVLLPPPPLMSCLSVSLSFCLSVCLSVCLCLCLCLCLSLSLSHNDDMPRVQNETRIGEISLLIFSSHSVQNGNRTRSQLFPQSRSVSNFVQQAPEPTDTC